MGAISDIHKRGTRSAQPAASAVAVGTIYFVTDESVTERSSGSAWESFSPTSLANPWALIASFTATSGATHDFTGLSTYNEIMVIFEAVTTSGNCILQILVSSDNGANFRTTSGDYLIMTDTMTVTNASNISCHNTQTSAARSGAMWIGLFNKTNYKPYCPVGHTPAANLSGVVAYASALNAIRVQPHVASGATFTGGVIRVWAR
jgi:hypothetical protein